MGSYDCEGWEVPRYAMYKWRLKEARDVIQCESKSLRPRGDNGVNSSQKVGEDMKQAKKTG